MFLEERNSLAGLERWVVRGILQYSVIYNGLVIGSKRDSEELYIQRTQGM